MSNESTAWKRVIERFRPIVPVVEARTGLGSGLLMPDGRVVITNRHVVTGSEFVKLRFHDGCQCSGFVFDRCQTDDLAIIVTRDLRPTIALTPIETTQCSAGDEILAIGHPQGYDFTTTRGIVASGRLRHANLDGGGGLVQVDVKIDHGSSGGPIVSESGGLVGISVAGHDNSSQLGFAIPATRVMEYYGHRLVSVLELVEERGADFDNDPVWNSLPAPSASECIAIALNHVFAEAKCELDPVVVTADDYTLSKWQIETSFDQPIAVSLVSFREGVGDSSDRLWIEFPLCQLAPEQASDSSLLLDALRTNYALRDACIALDDNNVLLLRQTRSVLGIDPIEVALLLKNIASLIESSHAKIRELRSGAMRRRPPRSLFDAGNSETTDTAPN